MNLILILTQAYNAYKAYKEFKKKMNTVFTPETLAEMERLSKLSDNTLDDTLVKFTKTTVAVVNGDLDKLKDL